MPVTDISQITSTLNALQLRETVALPPTSVYHIMMSDKYLRQSPMDASTTVLGKQGNQNAAALSPEDGIAKPRDCTQYPVVQENGQRRYGPPRNWRSDPPPRGCEVFIGKIPRDCFEEELIPVFEQIGPIYMFRLMMEFNGANRGYGFCVYTNREDTKRAVQELDNYEIRKGKTIGVCFSVDNCRLFVGGIPKNKTREEIMSEMKRVTEGVKDVISYPSITDKSKNRGFAFVEYESHKAAAMARRKLMPGRIQLWNQQIAVDWAEPEREVNEDIMSKVKILYVRNLMLNTTEETLRERFVRVAGDDPNCVERVKKISDYAFIHFKEREVAAKCLKLLNDTMIDGSKIEVTWAKPADKSEVNSRQAVNHSSAKLLNDLTFSKDGRTNNPLLLDPRTNAALAAASSLLPHLDPTIPFLLSPVGQQTLSSDMLTLNPSVTANPVSALALGNPGGLRLGGARSGRRNAAGSRGAGMMRDRKHPVEVLEEQCRLAGWGTPNFTILPADFVDTVSGAKIQLYVGHVFLPNLRLQFQAQRYYATPEEARLGACEAAIANLQFNQMMSLDGYQNSFSKETNGQLAPPENVMASVCGYQSILQPPTTTTESHVENNATQPAAPAPSTSTCSTSNSLVVSNAPIQRNADQVVHGTLSCTTGAIMAAKENSQARAESIFQGSQKVATINRARTMAAMPQPTLFGSQSYQSFAGIPIHPATSQTYAKYPVPHFVAIPAANLTSCPVIDPFTTSYALTLGTNVGSPGTTYLPLQFTPNGQSPNSTVGLLQTQALVTSPNPVGAQTPLGLSSPAEVSTTLGLNGFEYSASFVPNTFNAANLLASFANQPTYLVDPNSGAPANAMVVEPGNNLNGLPSVINMPRATGNGVTDLIASASVGQSVQVASNPVSLSGLYNLGLPNSSQSNKLPQMGTTSGQLVGLLSPGHSTAQTMGVTNHSLATAASVRSGQNSLNCLSVPTPVQLS